MKKIIYILIFVGVVSAAGFFYFSTVKKADLLPITVGGWAKYHNEKYGYTISYPTETLVDSSSVDSVRGIDGKEGPWVFAVTAADTTKNLSDFIESSAQEPERWVVEKTIKISGLEAVVAHTESESEMTPPTTPTSDRTVFLKKGNIIFKFDARGFDTSRFIENIRFE